MIRYRKQNALQPEKDAEVSVNLTPLMFFLVGFLAMKALLRTALTASCGHDPLPQTERPAAREGRRGQREPHAADVLPG
ncbi:hypothetical protein CTI14_67735, partial [Methylobacterium radiotolerans]